jgi:hypothetical protein
VEASKNQNQHFFFYFAKEANVVVKRESFVKPILGLKKSAFCFAFPSFSFFSRLALS